MAFTGLKGGWEIPVPGERASFPGLCPLGPCRCPQMLRGFHRYLRLNCLIPLSLCLTNCEAELGPRIGCAAPCTLPSLLTTSMGVPHAVWSLSPGPPTQRLLSGAGNPGALSGGSCNTQHCLCPGLLCSVPCKELRPSHGQPGHKPGLILPPCVGVSTLHLNGAFQPSLQGGSNFPISLTPNQEPQLYPSVSASCLPGLGVAPQAPLPPIFLLQARALHLPRDSQRT